MTSGDPTFAFATQLAGFAGMALNIVMRATTVDRRLKITGVMAMAMWTLHFVMLGACAGAACNAIEGLVTLLSLWAVPVRSRWVLAALPLVPAPWLVAGVTDALPIVSAVVCSAAMLATAGIGLRIVLLVASVLWLVYDFLNGSVGGVLTEVLSLVTLMVAIGRLRSRPAGPTAVAGT
jgi:hypothetical protein